jgi:erythromycin esterase-like protein
MEKYNGYSSYETWLVAVWIDNDQGNIDYIVDRAEEIYNDAQEQKYFTKQEEAVILLAEWMKDFYEENMVADTDGLGGLWIDMLTGALGSVDWHELAKKYMDQALENVETV